MADAIDWVLVARYLNHTCTAEERRAVVAWAGRDPANAALLDEARRVWEATGELPPAPEWDVVAQWGALQGRLDAIDAGREVEPTGAPARRPGVRARSGSGAQRRRAWLSDGGLLRRVGLAVAAVLVVALGVRVAWRGSRPVVLASRVYVTAPGERETVTLPDGTEFTLAPASRLTLAPGYGASRREIALTGEAYFVVVHDPSRPFVVRAANAVTTDIGTRFMVRAYATDAAARVVVADGAVSVAATGRAARRGEPPVLTRAMDMDVLPDGSTHVGRGVDLDVALGWTSGNLVFAGTPLREAARELSRWYGIDIEVGDPSLAGRPITASFKDERVDDVLRSMAAAVGATVERRGGTIVLVGAGGG